MYLNSVKVCHNRSTLTFEIFVSLIFVVFGLLYLLLRILWFSCLLVGFTTGLRDGFWLFWFSYWFCIWDQCFNFTSLTLAPTLIFEIKSCIITYCFRLLCWFLFSVRFYFLNSNSFFGYFQLFCFFLLLWGWCIRGHTSIFLKWFHFSFYNLEISAKIN